MSTNLGSYKSKIKNEKIWSADFGHISNTVRMRNRMGQLRQFRTVEPEKERNDGCLCKRLKLD